MAGCDRHPKTSRRAAYKQVPPGVAELPLMHYVQRSVIDIVG
jgi:hypothetical protein